MKLTQHGQNLWQLTRLTAFSCYLVREDDGLTVVDTNMSGTAQDIVKAAAEIGLPISRITLTHAHGDHAGSLDALAALQPAAEVAYGARTAEFLQGDLTLQPGEAQAKLRGGYVTCTTQASRRLEPGAMLGSLRVVASPGHTPDHVAFFDTRDGTLIAGDSFQTKAGTAVAGVTRWLFPFPAMATWHLPTAVVSARALAELQPERLAVGHGAVLENPGEEMRRAIAEAEEKVHAQT